MKKPQNNYQKKKPQNYSRIALANGDNYGKIRHVANGAAKYQTPKKDPTMTKFIVTAQGFFQAAFNTREAALAYAKEWCRYGWEIEEKTV